jgi:hypothetical protein
MRRMPYAAVNGLTLYYEVHGYGPPLVLLHGGTASIPEKWIPLLTPHFRVIAPEQMHASGAFFGDCTLRIRAARPWRTGLQFPTGVFD